MGGDGEGAFGLSELMTDLSAVNLIADLFDPLQTLKNEQNGARRCFGGGLLSLIGLG